MKAGKRAALCLGFVFLVALLVSCGAEIEPPSASSSAGTALVSQELPSPTEDNRSFLESIQVDGAWDTFSLERELTVSVACSGVITNTLRGNMYELFEQKLVECWGVTPKSSRPSSPGQ